MKPAATFLRTAIAVTLLAVPATRGAAQGEQIHVEHERFTLANGLTVILHRDTTTPTIASNIWFHVGSGREAPGRTGFAHLFEHIMFEGSAHVPEGAIDEWFGAVGGAPNGSTTEDRTNYFQSFSSNALDMALFIESDRMGYLLEAMSEQSVTGQRDVVKNERRQSYDNRPYGLASQLLTEALYPSTHPYSWPVIGYMDHLSAASHQDVVDFFRAYYAPNNAALVVAGNFEPHEARRLVEKWFGEIPAGPPIPEPEVTPPTLESNRRILLEDRVQLPRLYLAWISPAAYATDEAAAIALGQVLAGGKNSRLYRRLVYELQIADDVAAFQSGGKLGGEFQIMATARSGHALVELERVILEEVARLQAEPPDAWELERIVNQNEVAFLERLEQVGSKADQLNAYFFYTGTPDYFNQDLMRFRILAPPALSAAARRYLDVERRVTLSIVPLGRQDLGIPGSRTVPNQDLDISPAARPAQQAEAGR